MLHRCAIPSQNGACRACGYELPPRKRSERGSCPEFGDTRRPIPRDTSVTRVFGLARTRNRMLIAGVLLFWLALVPATRPEPRGLRPVRPRLHRRRGRHRVVRFAQRAQVLDGPLRTALDTTLGHARPLGARSALRFRAERVTLLIGPLNRVRPGPPCRPQSIRATDHRRSGPRSRYNHAQEATCSET
jgi:hypothetical protein